MDEQHRMIIEGEEYNCLLSDESMPYNCVKTAIPITEPELEPSVDITAIVTASVITLLAIGIFILAYKKARKKD